MIVFGTRPEAIKMAPLCESFRNQIGIETLVCVTAQHREMLDQVLDIFEIIPDVDLNIMHKGQNLSDVTTSILTKMHDTLKEIMPDIVLVHGDTTTTFATSLACFYLSVKVAHVEAGLRTHDLYAPFPEEYNRRSTGIIAKYHFAPTELSQKNLYNEGVCKENILVTGNTVIDALHLMLDKINTNKNRKNDIIHLLSNKLSFDWKSERFVLITGHRRENFGKGFLNICEAIKEVAIKNPEVYFVYPVHLNPNVKNTVTEILSNIKNIFLIDPLHYQDFVYLLKKSYLVLTDSGGIQEEAPSLGKPVLVMRDVTERPEAIKAGTVKLVGASKDKIISSIDLLLNDRELYSKMSQAHNPYGDGRACDRIVEYIKEKLHD